MYQPSHATTEIGRMRAEEMRARAERYRTIQKAKQHKKAAESEEQEVAPSRSRIYVYRKALGIVGLSVLMVLVFAGAALAMPLDAPPGVDGKHQTLVSKGDLREGVASAWEARTDVATRAEIRHLVSNPVGGQERAVTQHLVPGPIGGQERAALQHVADQQPTVNFDPAPGITSASDGMELEMVLLLSATVALASLGTLLWFRRHSIPTA